MLATRSYRTLGELDIFANSWVQKKRHDRTIPVSLENSNLSDLIFLVAIILTSSIRPPFKALLTRRNHKIAGRNTTLWLHRLLSVIYTVICSRTLRENADGNAKDMNLNLSSVLRDKG